MSRTSHHRGQRLGKLGIDAWRPGPLSGASKTTENMRLERQIMRRTSKESVRREQSRQSVMICPVTKCWYGWDSETYEDMK